MSTQALPSTKQAETIPPIVHYESQKHPGTSLCGAPVYGIIVHDPVDCNVCADLYQNGQR